MGELGKAKEKKESEKDNNDEGVRWSQNQHRAFSLVRLAAMQI